MWRLSLTTPDSHLEQEFGICGHEQGFFMVAEFHLEGSTSMDLPRLSGLWDSGLLPIIDFWTPSLPSWTEEMNKSINTLAIDGGFFHFFCTKRTKLEVHAQLCWYNLIWEELGFVGDLNHTLCNVERAKSPVGIKRPNVWTEIWKCSVCSNFSHFHFVVHIWPAVYAQCVKIINFWFAGVFSWETNMAPMVKLGLFFGFVSWELLKYLIKDVCWKNVDNCWG